MSKGSVEYLKKSSMQIFMILAHEISAKFGEIVLRMKVLLTFINYSCVMVECMATRRNAHLKNSIHKRAHRQ